MSAPVRFTDFNDLQRTSKPNAWLVAPPGLVAGAADAPAPVLSVAPAALAEAWQAVVLGQPRTLLLGVSADGLALEAVQRSRVFRFPDRISVRVLPAGEGQATFAAWSRAELGYYDFGVNRDRLQAWIALVEARLAGG